MPTDAKILTALIKKFFIKTILYKCLTALESADADQRVLYICSMKILLLIFKKIAIGIFGREGNEAFFFAKNKYERRECDLRSDQS